MAAIQVFILLTIYLYYVQPFKETKEAKISYNFQNNKKNNKLQSTTAFPNASIKFYSTEFPTVKNLIPSSENIRLNYCSFFNNRAPSPQVNLKNCTWYKENSCCLQAEIESTFSKVKPLIGSSPLCQQYLNNLMCYICAPNQFKFYGKERLTVCRQFCDKMYEACADAILKGSKINEIYQNGEEFCKSRRFNIDDIEKDKCFYYKVEPLQVNFSNSRFSFTSYSINLYIVYSLFFNRLIN